MSSKRIKIQGDLSSAQGASSAPNSDAVQPAESVAELATGERAPTNATAGDAPQLASLSVTKTLTVCARAICYPCAKGKEIQKNIKCAKCGTKRRTVLMVASPEFWPETRTHSTCARCMGKYSNGVYMLARSTEKWANLPVCCECYGADTPERHLGKA